MIRMDLSEDPQMIYYESVEMHTLFKSLRSAFSIDLIKFPSKFQILMDTLHPLIIYFESLLMQTLQSAISWARSIYLIISPLMFQILIDLSSDPLIMY